jgi:hypothetical protein
MVIVKFPDSVSPTFAVRFSGFRNKVQPGKYGAFTWKEFKLAPKGTSGSLTAMVPFYCRARRADHVEAFVSVN